MPTVNEIMRKGVTSVSPTTSIAEVAGKMVDHNAEIIAVCEKGKLRGIITKDIIISSVATDTRNHKKQLAKALMRNNVPKVSPGIDVVEAAKIMANHNVQNVPVVQNGQLLGVLTLKDLFNESPALTVMVMSKQNKSKDRPKRLPTADRRHILS